ncbi:hypothetical protein GSI_10496 [Ganoderma sinense ZZ0214-1]|uniref:DUF6535 domain-containing protein n=1 Tax=Ganoderma sinense ZZ0214-1 TaxID=1077348 RepID=A0A2G8S0Q1_9APHY|nr:hypothetical protein GSI_10496 [Ganoderma sinense ZZ0214-1]
MFQSGNEVDVAAELPSTDAQWEAPSREEAVKEYSQTYTEQAKAKAWKETAEIVKGYSDEKIERWIAEMDNLLVFSGLFSAVVTTFVAQTYPLLQPDAPDQTAAILQQISLQLSSFSINQPFVNSTQPAFNSTPADTATPAVSSSTVTLNILWFASLILSLSAALVAIMVKQWLSQYHSGLFGTSQDIARLRQYRLNNLAKWHVAAIVGALPVVLQLSLVLFFVGLLVLLRDLHPTIAKVASGLVAITFIIMGGTILLPVLWSDCCYLSSPAYFTATVVHNTLYGVKNYLDYVIRTPLFVYDSSRGTSRFRRALGKFHDFYIRHFDNEFYRGFMIWSLRERDIVRSSAAHLDADMICTAYSYTSDLCYLSETAATNLITLPPAVAIRCFRRLSLRMHTDYGFLRGRLLRINAQMPYAAAQSYKFWIAAMYQAMYLPESLSRPLQFLRATFNPPPGTRETDSGQEKARGVGPEAVVPIPWAVSRHMSTAIELVLHRQRTLTGPAELTQILGQRLFSMVALLLRCCTTSLASPDTTGATGKEEEVLACARFAITKLTSRLALQQCWRSEMLSYVESILQDLHRSASDLLTDDLLEAAAAAARSARASADAQEVSEAAQRLEEAVEDISGKQLDPASTSTVALTVAPDGERERSNQVWYVEGERRVIERYFGGLMVTGQRLY